MFEKDNGKNFRKETLLISGRETPMATAATDAEIDKCKGRPGNQKYYAPGFGCQTKESFTKIKECETPGSGNHYTSGVLGGPGVCLNKHGHPLDTPTITPTKEREVDWPRYRKCVGLCLLKDLGPAAA